MSIADAANLVGIGTGSFSLLSVFYLFTVKISRLELKVETLWSFLLRRGIAEGVNQGYFSMNSPLLIDQQLKTWMAEQLPGLRSLKIPKDITDTELAFIIEKDCGEDILKKVCIPQKMAMGACLHIAMEVVKDSRKVA